MSNAINLSDINKLTDSYPWVSVFSLCAELGYLNGDISVDGLQENVEITFYRKSRKIGYIRKILAIIHPTNPNLPHMNLEVKGSYVECFTTCNSELQNEAMAFTESCPDTDHLTSFCSVESAGLRFGFRLTEAGMKLNTYQQTKLLAQSVFKLTQFLRYGL
jgi:hypothetical protein